MTALRPFARATHLPLPNPRGAEKEMGEAIIADAGEVLKEMANV